MTATKGRNILVALGASGQAQLDGRQLISGEAQVIYLSLDGRALPVSQAVLLAPFSTGRTRLHSRRAWDDPVVLVGDVEGGQWRTFETRPGRGSLALDEDTMTCLMLICEREAAPRWTAIVRADALVCPRPTSHRRSTFAEATADKGGLWGRYLAHLTLAECRPPCRGPRPAR
jgi:hypothetical protein